MKDYRKWEGSRNELLNIIISLEKENPDIYKMYSKKLGKFLPVKDRRIQQFIDQDILPKAEYKNKNHMYNAEHIYRYIAAIRLKNSGHSLIQISKILKGLDLDEIEEEILSQKQAGNKFKEKQNFLINASDLPDRLKKLGREEGRVLRSQWLKFAITKWCHLEVKKKELKQLTEEDIETLVLAIKDSLLTTSKLKNIDKSIG